MTTLDYKKGEKRHFFSLYKPGQGTYVRWGTVAGTAVIILAGAFWLGDRVLKPYGILSQAVGVMIWITLGALISFYLVNRPNFAEFMIMTESEMRKVTWPVRRAVITSTRVVIFLTLLLAIVLYLVDEAFIYIFGWMHIL